MTVHLRCIVPGDSTYFCRFAFGLTKFIEPAHTMLGRSVGRVVNEDGEALWPSPFTDNVRALMHSTRAPLLRSHPSPGAASAACEYICQWEHGDTHPTLVRGGPCGDELRDNNKTPSSSRWVVWHRDDDVWCWGVCPWFFRTVWSPLLTVECSPSGDADVDPDDEHESVSCTRVLPPLCGWRKRGGAYGGEDEGPLSAMRFSIVQESVAMTHCKLISRSAMLGL